MLHPMRGFRLNVWQRIGIVLSLVWAVGTAGNAWQSWGDRKDDLDKAYFNCLFKPGTTPSDCDTKDSVRQAAAEKYAGKLLLQWLAPIPIAWLVVYGLIWLVGWIRRGFHPL
jgi:hypothetical protein